MVTAQCFLASFNLSVGNVNVSGGGKGLAQGTNLLHSHKSQGQTLDRVKVDLGKVFEKGESSATRLCYSLKKKKSFAL